MNRLDTLTSAEREKAHLRLSAPVRFLTSPVRKTQCSVEWYGDGIVWESRFHNSL